jgi:hypothetical protein
MPAQLGEYRAGTRHVVLYGVGCRVSMVAERAHGGGRHGGHAAASDASSAYIVSLSA